MQNSTLSADHGRTIDPRCPRCDVEGTIKVEDRPYPNDISPTSHGVACSECKAIIVSLHHDRVDAKREQAA